jgi:hypothetical protein
VTSASAVLEQSAVVFYQNDLPLCWVNIEQAIVLLVTGKPDPLYFYRQSGSEVHSPTCKQTWNNRRA